MTFQGEVWYNKITIKEGGNAMRENTNALVKPKGSKWAPLKPTELSAEEVAAVRGKSAKEIIG